MARRRVIAAVCAFLVAIAPTEYARAGGGLTGGALEITQLANNAELMAQVAESMQQTVQQINMLSTMLQNLKSLSNLAGIAQSLGIPLNGLENFIKAYKTTDGALRALDTMKTSLGRFGRNASSTASFYESLLEQLDGIVSQNQKITPAQLHSIMNQMSEDKRKRAQEVLAQRMKVLESMQQDYKYIQDNAAQIGSITGNVEGLQFIASQQSGLQRIMLDTQMAIQQMALEAQAERVENAEAAAAESSKAKIDLRHAFQRNAF